MERNKLDAGETTSFFTPLLQENDIALPCWQNDVADTLSMFQNGTRATVDPVSLPHMPLPVGSFDWKDMHGAFQQNTHYVSETCGNAMVDLNQLHNFQKPMIDPCSFNVGNMKPCLYGQDLQYSERNVKGTSHIRDVMNDSFDLNRFRDPGVDIRIPLIRSTIGGSYEQQMLETNVRNISGPQIHNFIGSGGSITYQTHNSNGPQIKNFVVSGGSKTNNTQSGEVASIVKKDELCAAQFGFPNNVDGSFLSLGIGSNPDIKLKSDLSSREPTGGGLYGAVNPRLNASGGLYGAVKPQLNASGGLYGAVNPQLNASGGLYGAVNPQLNASRTQQEAVRSVNPGHNFVGGRPSFQNNVGGFSSLGNHVGGWTSSFNNFGVRGGINTCPNTIQYPNVQKPEADTQHGFSASSTKDQAIAGDRNSRYPKLDAYKGFMGRCGSTSTQLLDSGQTAASGLESGSVELSWTARPTSDQLRNHLAESVNKLPAQSSMVSSLISSKGCSSRQEHSGQLFSTNDIAARSGADGGMFPKRVGVQVGNDSAPQASGSDLFPHRLGVHVNEYRTAPATSNGLFPKSTGTEGCSHEGLQAHLQKDLIRPSFPTGQAFSTANGSGLSQASDVLGVPLPSLKRRAMPPPPPRVQRRKVTLPPPIHPYILSSQAAPALPHIKWQGLGGLPQPIGQRCMLCRRDLSFTPEGPVHQPTVPPSVAVLPCGHTFHDNCLQTMTPEDQAKDPPCIPCAIGEI